MSRMAFKLINIFVLMVFLIETTMVNAGYAQSMPLASSAAAVGLSEGFHPVIVRGITLNPENALSMNFIVDSGDVMDQVQLSKESEKLIKYFLAALTISEKDLWVNLSPYEKDRIVADALGKTDMGRDMLALDYMLKQMTATLLNPDDETGKKFWDKIYSQIYSKYGKFDLPVESLNKVWIMPDKVELFAQGDTVLIINSRMKVMLEGDYLATDIYNSKRDAVGEKTPDSAVTEGMKGVMRDVIIPVLEEEVNHGEHFAQLRQIFNSLILAKWFKENLKTSILNRAYSDQEKISGVDHGDAQAIENIYQQYVAAFQKGSEGFIKEDYDPQSQEMTAKKYIAGGENFRGIDLGSLVGINRAQDSFKDSFAGQPIYASADFSPAMMNVKNTIISVSLLSLFLFVSIFKLSAQSLARETDPYKKGFFTDMFFLDSLLQTKAPNVVSSRFIALDDYMSVGVTLKHLEDDTAAARQIRNRKRIINLANNLDRFNSLAKLSAQIVAGRLKDLGKKPEDAVIFYEMDSETTVDTLIKKANSLESRLKGLKDKEGKPLLTDEQVENIVGSMIPAIHLVRLGILSAEDGKGAHLVAVGSRSHKDYDQDENIANLDINVGAAPTDVEVRTSDNNGLAADKLIKEGKLIFYIGKQFSSVYFEEFFTEEVNPYFVDFDKQMLQLMMFVRLSQLQQELNQFKLDSTIRSFKFFPKGIVPGEKSLSDLDEQALRYDYRKLKDLYRIVSYMLVLMQYQEGDYSLTADDKNMFRLYQVSPHHLESIKTRLKDMQEAASERGIDLENDQAMMFKKLDANVNGGIDFDSSDVETETRGSGIDISIKDSLGNIDPAMIQGFSPVNIRLIPIQDIGVLFGKSQSKTADQKETHLSALIV